MAEESTAAVEETASAIDTTDPSQIMDWFANNGMDIAIQVGLAVVIFVVGRWVAQWVTSMIRKALAKTDMEDTLERFLCNIVYTALLAIVVIAALGQLGVETTSLLAIFGAAGLAVGLALQGSLSNFAAGVLIVAFRPYKVGDFIEAGGESGSVDEVQIFTTILKSPDKNHRTTKRLSCPMPRS